MNVTEKPSLAPHRCKVCGHTPPITPGAADAKAPYIDLHAEDDHAYVMNIYLCAGCVKKMADLIFPRLGLVAMPVDEKRRLDTTVAELEVKLAVVTAEADKQRDLLVSLVDLPTLVGLQPSGDA